MTVLPFAEPLDLGRLRLRNRFVSAPMERNYCEVDGTMTERYTDYLARRAAGGAALVFTEASYVRADGKGRVRQLGVDVDERVPALARMAEAVHAHGALVGVELNHGGRTAQGAVSGYVPVAPSPIPCAVVGGELPEQLDGDDIEHLVECFGEAAARCQAAGIDVISLHGGHGYLIHQFLSPAYNHRDDEWADPVRFVNRVIDSVRRHAPDVALGIRFSAFEGVEGGLDADLTRARIDAVDTHRLDFLDVSAGNYEAGQWIIQPGEWPQGLLAGHAAPYTRDFDIPVGVAGRISSPGTAASIIGSGQADFVSLARTLHADPDFPLRALDGGRYRPCIACNYCIDSLAAGPVPCTVNPWVGREREQPQSAAPEPVRVAVVGAGPAGLGVARELALAGHGVDLFDERSELGGDFALAAHLHEYPDYARILDWYDAEVADLDVAVHLGRRVDAATLRGTPGDRTPDAIVLATGGRGFAPTLPGDGTRVVRDVRELLADLYGAGSPAVDVPEQVTVYGADREAAAVADDLLARGTRVVLVAPQEQVAQDVGRRAKIVLLPRLAEAEAEGRLVTHLSSVVRRVEAGRLLVATGGEERWVEAPGELLVSHGIEPRNELLDDLRALAPRLGVHSVGDAGGDGGSVHVALVSATEVAARITEAAAARTRVSA